MPKEDEDKLTEIESVKTVAQAEEEQQRVQSYREPAGKPEPERVSSLDSHAIVIERLDQRPERPMFAEVYMRLARALSERSTCARLSVGCAIVSADNTQVLAVGYNGNAAGLHNGCDTETPGACGCLHAEENAVIHCHAPREQAKVVICTHLPCAACAKRIIQLGGVMRVIYAKEYRSTRGADLLRQRGISVVLLDDLRADR